MKMNQLYKHILLGLTIAGVYTPATQPMHRAKEFGKKAFHKGCTALHWGIFAVPPVTLGLTQLDKINKAKQLNDTDIAKTGHLASPLVTAFAHKELHKTQFENAHEIYIMTHDNSSLASAPIGKRGAIFVPQKTTWVIVNGSDQEKNALRATLHHELTHLVQSHSEKRAIAQVTMPFILHYGLKIASYPVQVLLRRRGVNISNPTILRSVAKIPTAFIKAAILEHINNSHSRSQEWDADEGIPNDPILLHAKAHYHASNHLHAQLRILFDEDTEMDHLNTDPTYNLLATHPRCIDRAERLEKRALLIEAEQAAAQNKD